MFFLTGIVLAGSEAETVTNQFLASMAGLFIMAGAAYGLTRG